MKQSNYDFVAPFYDRLSRIVFGSNIVDAQICLLPFIAANNNILIVGGGSGWILEKIADHHPGGLIIHYVELSGKMVEVSKKRNTKNNTVNFINSSIENCAFSEQYDIVITPFLFDNFSKETVSLVFEKLNKALKHEGLWLFADFFIEDRSPLWQKGLLRVMYLFFRLTTNLKSQQLISMHPYFASDYSLEFDAKHFSKFIRSAVYKKTRH